jgi:hypothetical protein
MKPHQQSGMALGVYQPKRPFAYALVSKTTQSKVILRKVKPKFINEEEFELIELFKVQNDD